MATLSISKAWSETTEFLRREWKLVMPVAFAFISLPGALMQLALPVQEPGVPPDVGELLAMLPLLVAMILAVVFTAIIGTIAINYLAIRPGTTVGEALAVGARRFIFLLLASLLLGLGALVLCLPMFAIFAVSAPAPPSGGLVVLLVLVYFLLFIGLWIRLMLTTPVTAAEDVGPIGIITRSWALTQGHFWKLLGFVILFWIAAIIAILGVSLVIGIIIALAAGLPTPGSTAAFLIMLLSAVLQAIVTSFFAVATSRIYVQLAGEANQAQVFA